MNLGRFKSVVAVIMSAAMIMGSSVMAMAADSGSKTLSGNGTWEGHMDKSVFNVTLPTAAADTFDFKFDPEKLISQTNNARYSAETFDSTARTVYFLNKDNTESPIWKDKSTTVSTANLSSVSVDLTAKVTVTSANGITFVSENAALTGTDRSMWLALVDPDDSNKEYPVEKSGESLTVTYSKTVDAMPADKYYAMWDVNNNEYRYVLSGNAVAEEDQIVNLYMTGAANEGADWSGNTANPKVEVVWNVAKHSDAIDAAVVEYEEGTVYITLVAGQKADSSKITSIKLDGETVASSRISVTGSGKVVVSSAGANDDSHILLISYDGSVYKATY